MDEQIDLKFKEFINFVDEQRRIQNITKDELSEKIGVNRATLFNWLAGNTKMKLSNYWKILTALNVAEELKPKTTLTKN